MLGVFYSLPLHLLYEGGKVQDPPEHNERAKTGEALHLYPEAQFNT